MAIAEIPGVARDEDSRFAHTLPGRGPRGDRFVEWTLSLKVSMFCQKPSYGTASSSPARSGARTAQHEFLAGVHESKISREDEEAGVDAHRRAPTCSSR